MKNVRLMSYKELYDKFQIYLDIKYLGYIITDEDVLKDFKEKFYSRDTSVSLADFLKKFLEENSNAIDNEAYVFYTLKSIKEKQLEFAFPKIVARCVSVLENSNLLHFEVNELSNWNDDEIQCVTAQDLIASEYSPKTLKKKSDSERIIENIDKVFPFEDCFTIHSTSEMEKYFGKNDDLNRYITKISFIDALDILKHMHLRDKRRLLEDCNAEELHQMFNEKITEIYDNVPMDVFIDRIPQYVRKYPEQFDLDMIFLIAAFRTNECLESVDLTEEQEKSFVLMLQALRDNIKNHSLKVSGLDGNDGTMIGRGLYSYKTLLKACSRITKNGKYVSSIKEMDIKDKVIENPSEIIQVDPEIIRILGFTMQDYKMIAQKEGALLYLVENKLIMVNELHKILNEVTISENDFAQLIRKDLISKAKITEYIEKEGHIGQTIFETLEEKETFTSEEKLKHFINGVIELDSLDSMTDEKKREISDLLSPEELMYLYKDETKKAEYLRYASIFRNMVLTGKTKEHKDEIGEQMIEAIGMDLEDEDLVELYNQHLISLGTVEGWSGSHVITQMMRQAMLRPADVKEICSNGNYDCLFDIMKDVAIPRKNKLAIFYTTFCDEDDSLTQEQRELRDLAKEECLKYMRFSDKSVNFSKGKKGTRGPRVEDSEKRNEYVSDPLNRWTLFRLLDQEYSYEILDQGMMIFKCPNLENGTIILEKMFRKGQPDYGRATKVLHMPIEDFEKIKNDLIIEGDIPVIAVESHPVAKEKVESVWHGASWGKKLADIFDYSIDSQRSKEDIERIDKAIDRIKQSRKLRD